MVAEFTITKKNLRLLNLVLLNGFLVPKETVVLRWWEGETKSGFLKRVDKFFHELSKSFTMVIQPLLSRFIKPNFSLL